MVVLFAFLLIGCLGMTMSSPAKAAGAPSPHQFGMALQASLQCIGLQMRSDTEYKINADRSTAIRFSEGFDEGLYYAMDRGGAICDEAWSKFGCDGDEVPNLLQHSPIMSPNREICIYRAL